MYLHECVLQTLHDLESGVYTYAGSPAVNLGFNTLDNEETFTNAGAESQNRGFLKQSQVAPPAASQMQRGTNVARQQLQLENATEDSSGAQPTASHAIYEIVAAVDLSGPRD